MVRQTNPLEALKILESEPTAVYLDVRTVSEFEAGHPPGAYNVPVGFFEPPRRDPILNDLFSRICEMQFAKTTRLLVGCQSGARSIRAAEILQALGYSDVTNVDGGFGGRRDAHGKTIERGWIEYGFPIEKGSPIGRGYEELRRRFVTPMPTLNSSPKKSG